jgi:hypothetical protein
MSIPWYIWNTDKHGVKTSNKSVLLAGILSCLCGFWFCMYCFPFRYFLFLSSCSTICFNVRNSLCLVVPVFTLQILIGGDFRIIDGEKIWSRVRRPLVGSGQSPGMGCRGKHTDFGLCEFWLAFKGVY